MDFKTYVLSVPRFDWRSMYGKRARLFLGLLVCSLLILYWKIAWFPYVWIPHGHVEMFTWNSSFSDGKKVVFLGPGVGEQVKKGDPLYAIDSSANADRLAWLRGRLSSLEQEVVLEKKRMDQAMQAYFSSLQKETAVPDHLAALEEAQNGSEKAVEALAAVRGEILLLEGEIEQATIGAPFDGVVLSRTNGDQQPVVSLIDPKKVWVRSWIPESKIGSIAVGTKVDVQFASDLKKWKRGVIAKVDPFVQGGMLGVEIALSEEVLALKPGLSANVRLKVR